MSFAAFPCRKFLKTVYTRPERTIYDPEMRRWLLVAALVASLMAAVAAPAPPAVRCGSPTSRAQLPERFADIASGRGLRLGPIWLVRYAYQSAPLKTFVLADPPPEADVTLRGRRCSDGKLLRFWFGDGSPPPRSRAPRAATFPAGTSFLTGYLLPASAGRWRVEAWQKGRIVGAVVLRLRAFENDVPANG
jgi:hypothetical protein